MRKIVSAVLTICIVCSICLYKTPVASAAGAVISPEDVVSTAESLVGKYPKYVSGGRSPSDGGFDCSGLVYYVFNTCLGSDVTYTQIWNRSAGTKIENQSDFQRGDVVFGLNQNGGWHTGIYIGNNTMIHSGSSKGVSKTSMSGWFTVKFARRLTASDNSSSVATDCDTHTKGTYLWCEKAHPHYNYFTCVACGATFTDGTTEILSSCTECQSGASTGNQIIAPISNGTYTLAPQCASNLRLDVASGSTENKANIQIYQANGTAAQQFEFTHLGDGYYSITAKVSGKCLDVQEGKKASGTNVWQYTPNATDAQKWRLEDAGDGYYYIVPKLNTSLCLDVYSAKNENRTNVQVYTRNQTSAQKWTLIPLNTASETVPAVTPSNSGYWGPWSEWSTSYAEESSTRHVESQQVKVSDGRTEYRYGRYIDSTGAYVGWCAQYMSGRYSTSASVQYSDWSTTRYVDNGTKWTCGYCGGDHAHALYTSSDGRAFWARHVLPEGNFYWEESRVVDAQYETQYRYQDWIPG